MSQKVRAVLDTNVLISFLLTTHQSAIHNIYLAFKAQTFVVITSPQIIAECEAVLHREHITLKYHITEAQIQKFVQSLYEVSMSVEGKVSITVVREDPDDDKFIAAAIEGWADYIVSGDPHLLNIKEYQGIKIISPSLFLAHI